MSRINLLPWREEKRRESQRQFMLILALVVASAIGLVILGNAFANAQVESQADRNRFLQSEIRKLDLQIRKIDELEQTRNALLARKEIIEGLQSQRSLTVMMLDELVKTTPVGVTLNNIRQQGNIVTLSGTTQSNARVSVYLQNLEASNLFISSDVQIIEAQQEARSAVEPYGFIIVATLFDPSHPEHIDSDGNPAALVQGTG